MHFEKIYVAGQWQDAISSDWILVENPATGEVVAKVPRGGKADVDAAVKAAKTAFESWQYTELEERLGFLERALGIFSGFESELVETEVLELGSPIGWAKPVHVIGPIKRFEKYLKIAPELSLEHPLSRAKVVREPVGVVACITPWNYPLDQVIQKVIPALITGNTVVLKPSQITPLSVYYLAQAFHEAGLPKGVFNLVTGAGGEVGNVLASHEDVSMVSFTGSTAGGVEVGKLAMESVKKIALELGGKSPHVLLPSDDYTAALKKSLDSCFYNTGQTCSALTRLIVPRGDLGEIEALVVTLASQYTLGDPKDPHTQIGPLASAKQWDKVSHYIDLGLKEGATLLVGRVPEKPSKGYFMNPVVFTNVTSDMTIAKEEIFGPVLSILAYDTIEEAVQMANDTLYGLSAAVSGPAEQASKVARQIKSGSVYINQGKWDPLAPFGGYKQSGIGREGGFYGLEEFLEIKAVFF